MGGGRGSVVEGATGTVSCGFKACIKNFCHDGLRIDGLGGRGNVDIDETDEGEEFGEGVEVSSRVNKSEDVV